MAKYDLKRTHKRTAAEHRAIIDEIDALHSDRSQRGVVKSTGRSVGNNKKRKRHKNKPRIYDIDRHVDLNSKFT